LAIEVVRHTGARVAPGAPHATVVLLAPKRPSRGPAAEFPGATTQRPAFRWVTPSDVEFCSVALVRPRSSSVLINRWPDICCAVEWQDAGDQSNDRAECTRQGNRVKGAKWGFPVVSGLGSARLPGKSLGSPPKVVGGRARPHMHQDKRLKARNLLRRNALSPSWPGVSGPPIAARAGTGGPDTPGHDGEARIYLPHTPILMPMGPGPAMTLGYNSCQQPFCPFTRLPWCTGSFALIPAALDIDRCPVSGSD
jgi:hypothetical protein